MTPTTAAVSAATAPRGFEVHFLPDTSRVAEMRRITATHLRSWEVGGLVDSAALIVSELITNAIRHGDKHGAVNLTVKPCDQALRIEVADGNPIPARRQRADEDDESGRGLEIVAALAKDWGVSPDGTTTWAVLQFSGQTE